MRDDKLLNWGTYSSTTVLEHRAHGTKPITLETFSNLTDQLDTFDDAFTDHHNAYNLTAPAVSSIATTPSITTESQIRAIVEAYLLSNSKPPAPAQAPTQQLKKVAPPSGGRGGCGGRGIPARIAKPEARPAAHARDTTAAPAKIRCADPKCPILHSPH